MTAADNDEVTVGMTETWMTADSSTESIRELNVDVYLEQHLGRRHHSAVESAALTAIYLLILLTGVQCG